MECPIILASLFFSVPAICSIFKSLLDIYACLRVVSEKSSLNKFLSVLFAQELKDFSGFFKLE